MRKIYSIISAVAIVFCVSSCYKIFGVDAPKEVKQGETFTVTYTVVTDYDTNAKYLNDWSVAGLRVPEGWEVTTSSGAYKGYAEDWVYFETGTQANKKYPMKANDAVTAIYNEACKKEGYKWFGFESRAKIPKDLRGCWMNACDSVSMTFNVTVPIDCQPGEYILDFIGGDIENDGGMEAFADASKAKNDSRAFHVGTVDHSYIDNKNTALACKVTVVADEAAGVAKVTGSEMPDVVYTLDGKRVDKPRKGVNIINGKKIRTNK